MVSVPQSEKLARTTGSLVQITRPGDGKVKVSDNLTLARKRRLEQERGEKSELYSEEKRVLRKRGKASKESLPNRSRRKHKRKNMSGPKKPPGGSADSRFHSKSGQT